MKNIILSNSWRFVSVVFFFTILISSCNPECPPQETGKTFMKEKLAEGTPFLAYYTSTTIESLTIEYPANLNAEPMNLDDTHATTLSGNFAIAKESSGNRNIKLEKAGFLYPSLNLVFDAEGDGKADTISTGDIMIKANKPNSEGILNEETGEISFNWEADISFFNNAVMPDNNQPITAIASTNGTFDVNDGYLKEETVFQISSGILKGTIVKFLYSKTPPDIACQLKTLSGNCLLCASIGDMCRVGGVVGDCQQVLGGCACKSGGKLLRIYRCR